MCGRSFAKKIPTESHVLKSLINGNENNYHVVIQ